jgi:hypothetical protein
MITRDASYDDTLYVHNFITLAKNHHREREMSIYEYTQAAEHS